MGGNGKSGGVSSPFATLGSLRSAATSSGSSSNDNGMAPNEATDAVETS